MIYIVLNHPPSFSSGGIGSVVREIICNIDDSKNNIRLVCNGINNDMREFCGIPIISLETRRFKLADFIFLYSHIVFSYKLYSFIKENIKDGDVVNIHEGNGISFFLNLFRKRIKKNFVIMTTIHSLIAVYYSNMIKYLPGKYIFAKLIFLVLLPYFWFVEKIYLMNVDYVINISYKTRSFIKKYYRKNFNGLIIRNGMSGKEVSIKKKNDGPKNAIIVGSVTYPKGLDIAVKSIIKFNKDKDENEKINLSIIGFRDFEKYYNIKEISQFIKYIGPVEYENMSSEYNNADFMIFPSRSEEFASLVVLEALQHNLPIIVSRKCNINEMENHENWGTQVQTWDIEDWVMAIDELCSGDIYQEKKQNIINHDFSEYNWKTISEKYQKLFNQFSKEL